MECYERFNAYGMFFDGRIGSDAHRHRIYHQYGAWFINCGSIFGLPDDPVKPVIIVVYDSSRGKLGYEEEIPAQVVFLDMKESEIEIAEEHRLDKNKGYPADILTLPVPPLNVYLSGDQIGQRALRMAFIPEYVSIINFVSESVPTKYKVECTPENYRILALDTGRIIFEIPGSTTENASNTLCQLARIERWERILRLKNPRTRLNPAALDFVFFEMTEEGEEIRHNSREIRLHYREKDGKSGEIPYVLKLKNSSTKKLFFTLLYLSPDFGIYSLMPCQVISYSGEEVILDDTHAINIPDESYTEVIDTFLLLVSTEKLDEFLFVQEDIGKEFDVRNIKKRKDSIADWFSISITVKTTRQLRLESGLHW
jgi:hypothetical protein